MKASSLRQFPIFLFVLVAWAGALRLAADTSESRYPYRWLQINFYQPDFKGEVDRFREIADLAVEHGYNGILVMGSFDALDIESVYVHKALREVRQICEERGLDLIPTIMNVGYNSFILQHNRHLAEGLPVKDVLFVAGAERAEHVPESVSGLDNGGFEEVEKGLPTGFDLDPAIASIDREVVGEGAASLKFSNYGEQPAVLTTTVGVRPNRLYRVRFRVRSDDTGEMSPYGPGRFRVDVHGGGLRQLNFFDPQVPPQTDWRQVELAFNSFDYDSVVLEIGIKRGGTGSFWLDDLVVEEIGLVNVLRRPGTPLVVKDEDTGIVYEEGRDYRRVEDALFNFLFDHDGPAIHLLPETRIREGSRLRVDYYHAAVIYQGQTPVCMSEPEVHAIWKRLAKVVHDTLGTDMYLLNLDEVRVAASCEACKARGIPAARMIGEALEQQMAIVREVNPDAQFFTWSDMFDPFHNARHDEDEPWYYFVNETFHGSWEYLPKDLTIINWNRGRKRQSAEFFSDLGYPMVVAAYYDREDLGRDHEWREVAEDVGNVEGYLYSTWLDQYGRVEAFKDIFEAARRPAAD